MPGNKIEQYAHAALFRLFEQADEVLVRSEARIDALIIRHVVPAVAEGRTKERVQPDAVAPQPRHVIQFLYDAFDVAHAVPVRIEKLVG